MCKPAWLDYPLPSPPLPPHGPVMYVFSLSRHPLAPYSGALLIKISCQNLHLFYVALHWFYVFRWHGWLVHKALASHKGDPGSIPGQGHM